MGDGEALLRAVIDHPDDDTPRLVYADWLDDHGDPARAEFIRTQIELAGDPKPRRRATLERRERALLDDHAETWVEPIREFIYEDWSDEPYRFRRGFVEWIDVLGEMLIESGAELFAAAPITAVRMPDEESFGALARCRHLLRLRSIDLTASGIDDGRRPATLFRSRYLGNLTTLIAQGYDDNCHLGPAGIRAIVGSEHLGKLTALDLSNNWFGPTGVRALGGPFALSSLERLELEGVGVRDDGAVELAAMRWVRQLKVLNLVANGVGEAGARALLNSPHLSHLDLLDLRDNRVAAEDPEEPEPISQDTSDRLRARFGDRVLLDGGPDDE